MTELQEMLVDGRWMTVKETMPAWGLSRILVNMGSGITGAEIGVHAGLSSYLLLSECSNIKKLVGIDHFLEYNDWDRPVTQATQDQIFGILQEHIKLMGTRYKFIKETSEVAATKIKDGTLDFIYLDGDHSTEATYQDLVRYVPKVKSGGIISGHDIGLPSVLTAIDLWRNSPDHNGTELERIPNNSWFWYKN